VRTRNKVGPGALQLGRNKAGCCSPCRGCRMSDNAAEDIFLIYSFLLSNVAHWDATPYPSNFLFIFSQESHVAVNSRIRESFVVGGNLCRAGPLRINRHTLPFPSKISRSNKHSTEFRIKSSMHHSRRWTPKSKTSSTRRHGGSTLVSSSLPQRCVWSFAMDDWVFSDNHGLNRI
jgi:hypothetical protein